MGGEYSGGVHVRHRDLSVEDLLFSWQHTQWA
jgi:hypothetical protein